MNFFLLCQVGALSLIMTTSGCCSFFAFIRNIFGSVALSNVREYINLSTTVIRLECHQDLNRQCIQRGPIPQGLCWKPLVDTPNGRMLARDFSLNCVNARVQDNNQSINPAKKRQATAELNLRHVRQYDDLCSIFVACRGRGRGKEQAVRTAQQEARPINAPETKFKEREAETDCVQLLFQGIDGPPRESSLKGINFAIPSVTLWSKSKKNCATYLARLAPTLPGVMCRSF